MSHHFQYKFLVDNKDPEHAYYRWKLHSILQAGLLAQASRIPCSFALQGDDVHRWRTDPFIMVKDGPVWYPPLIFDEDHATERGKLSVK